MLDTLPERVSAATSIASAPVLFMKAVFIRTMPLRKPWFRGQFQTGTFLLRQACYIVSQHVADMSGSTVGSIPRIDER
jgi:hypothetical protein